ncbi:MAG TPA: hypothetical protein VEH27_13060 [Methylomirabilota bacterium]|nr:hypothetical protein [Methylomirabilota bacterium]
MKSLADIGLEQTPGNEARLIHAINIKLAELGFATVKAETEEQLHDIARAILARESESSHRAGKKPPVDQRVEKFLERYLGLSGLKLPERTFVLDEYGLARTLSLPLTKDEFVSDIISSYRVKNGVLHNPKSDRRTTQGIFHIAEGGLPVPADKTAVPKEVFARLFEKALQPPPELLELPFTFDQAQKARCWVSLLLRPILCPAVEGFTSQKTMEVRFFAPGNLVSNLDFVESIFGNGGDPNLPENDAALDVEHWSGHTGCVILAPHLVRLTKKELGLPHYSAANERQRRDGVCWREEDELYNNGNAFKITCRDASGVMVTIIADNYFGYCKKEVKTQLSFAANLFGLCEEEHAGGAYVYPSYDLGEEFSGQMHLRRLGHSFHEVVSLYRDVMDVKPEGYAVDKNYPDIIYVPDDAHFDLLAQRICWTDAQGEHSIRLMAERVYVRPSGYKVRLVKTPGTKNWRLIGSVAEGTLCHKPCTVSGGGKSEISKSISDAILQGPVFVADLQEDFALVDELLRRDYSDRFKPEFKTETDSRPILSEERSLGSVIKLLTPSTTEYTQEYNNWLSTIPQYVKQLVFVVKRYYRPTWGANWRDHFSVDIVNGRPGNELKYENRKVVTSYLRVGYDADGAWRTFGLRKDFQPADKIQAEDDITASITVPVQRISGARTESSAPAVKFVLNCENRLFQRPDEAIHKGYDKQTEADFSRNNNFFSNFEPLKKDAAQEYLDDAIGFDQFTAPMQGLIRDFATNGGPTFFVSSCQPRIIGGKPSKNPRYLQTRPDLVNQRDAYLALMATRLHRRLPLHQAVHRQVGAVLPGRRNNPPDSGIRPLAVYNPIHYMELPELFMEFICSMTGKSPSTTGAGSEGALTKGPFNALPPIYDLNNALVAYLLNGHQGFVTAAGYVGPYMRVDHDISLLVPEIWARMSPQERDPKYMIEHGYLEKLRDFKHNGKEVLASRIGYRITSQFAVIFFGRVFNHPHVVLTPEMLRPELQDMEVFVDGIDNIVTTQKRVADLYFEDGSIEWACPPLKALLHIMAHGHYEGKGLNDPAIRSLFTLEHLLGSDWYRQRLETKQRVDVRLWERHVASLQRFVEEADYVEHDYLDTIQDRLEEAKRELQKVSSPQYLEHLHGTIGAQPIA